MKLIFTNISFLLTARSDHASGKWCVHSEGDTNYDRDANAAHLVVPALYLNSELSVKDGDGTQNTPYQLSVN